ncbi:Uncharacterised protein [Escherichia coli]|nr:Uncharacterised protein [Escherichia coli]
MSGCDVFVDGNIAISLQRQSRISTIGFIDISINGNVPVLISTCCCTAGQNSDARPVIQLIIDAGIADLRARCGGRELRVRRLRQSIIRLSDGVICTIHNGDIQRVKQPVTRFTFLRGCTD